MDTLKMFVVVALLGAASAAAVDAEDATLVGAALAEDDQCAASGEEGALCMLNALQLKAEKLAADSQDDERDVGDCATGMVGQIQAFDTLGCLIACPQMCGPIGSTITAYMTNGGGQPAAKAVVCANENAFSCALIGGAIAKCEPLISKAASFGFHLPQSLTELNSQC